MASTKSLDEKTAKKVFLQVEFYFSDGNLRRDAFLKKTIGESDDGMVSLALISSFPRMRGHLRLGDVKPEDVSDDTLYALAETLRASTVLKVSEDGKKVGRSTELPKIGEAIKQSNERTIAASPLEYGVKLEDIESFFAQCAKVNSVRLPRHVVDTRVFCGTALIEFSTEEDAKNVLKKSLSYSGVELELKPKEEFDRERAEQEEKVVKPRSQVGSNRKDKANKEPEYSYPKGLIVAFKLMNITAGDSTESKGSLKPASDNSNISDINGGKDKMQEAEQAAVIDAADMKNHVSNFGRGEDHEVDNTVPEMNTLESEDTEKSQDIANDIECEGLSEEKSNIEAHRKNKNVVLREDLKSIFQEFGTVKFIDFQMGSKSGYIRFKEAKAAQKAQAAAALTMDGGLFVKNFIVTLDPVTGLEQALPIFLGNAEKEYWSLLRIIQDKHRDNYKSSRGRCIRFRGGRRRGGGNRHLGGKRSRSRENESHLSNKFQKVGAA